jgi:hypothetical protein
MNYRPLHPLTARKPRWHAGSTRDVAEEGLGGAVD